MSDVYITYHFHCKSTESRPPRFGVREGMTNARCLNACVNLTRLTGDRPIIFDLSTYPGGASKMESDCKQPGT